MVRKKQKDQAKAAAKAAKKAKTAQKTERKEAKKVGKSKTDAVDEENLDVILENLRREWEASHAVTEEIADGPPSRRVNATLTACPSGNYLWCIGGDLFSDDGKAYFYNDVYRYNPEKNDWRKFISRICPGPRSAHAVVASPSGGGKLFLFGGEFSSLYQNSFHHYRDFWCFDLTNHTWDRIETKIRPSARSGCRMAMWKHYIFLFGGFYDPGIRTTYLDDLWYFDTQEYYWKQIELREGERRPTQRSGFSFLSTAEGIVLYGGYCKEYAKGKRPLGIMLDDAWLLRIYPSEDDTSWPSPARKSPSKGTQQPFNVKWEKRKKTGYAPGPRVGCTMAAWTTRAMGILFGGVTDDDPNEETLESVYHNDLFGYQLNGNGRWVSLTLRKSKSTGKKASDRKHNQKSQAMRADNGNSDSGVDAENKAATAQMTHKAKDGPRTVLDADDSGNEPADPMLAVPCARYNAMLSVLRNTLYIYGGILEMGPKEFTLDDFYSLSLDKLDRYVCIKPCEVELPKEGQILESSSDEDDEDDDSESESSEEDSVSDERSDNPERINIEEISSRPVEGNQEPESAMKARAPLSFGSSTPAEQSIEDNSSTPLPGETLAAFYARTREYWAGKAHSTSDNRGKLLRRDGFALAQERYAEYKPVLEEVEEILADAGLDENEIKQGAGATGPRQEGNRNRR